MTNDMRQDWGASDFRAPEKGTTLHLPGQQVADSPTLVSAISMLAP